MADSSSEKTHEPTPHRREQFRKEGRFARARDAGGIAAIAAVLAALVGLRGASFRAATELFARCHGDLSALSHGGPPEILTTAGSALFALAAPAAFAAA